ATATANMQLALSTSAEVTVTGEAPLIDSTSTTSGSNYSGKVIDKLPMDSRNYAAVVLSQPGVQIDNGESQGRSPGGTGGTSRMSAGGISVYGSTSAENNFLIDGVNTTNVIKGIQGKDINNEFVQEVEVKTSGYQAEYGRNTGGVVNVITKSGGNEFHGNVFGYYNSLDLAASQKNVITPDNSQIGNSQVATIATKDTRSEGGLDLGGFFVKDRVWFFGAYDRVLTTQVFNPTSGVTGPMAACATNPAAGEGCPFPDAVTENKYSGKLTLNLAQSTTLQGVYFSDRQSTTGTISANPQSFNPFATQGRLDVGGPDYGARLNQLFGSTGILALSYGQHSDRFETKPEGPDVPQLRDRTLTPFSYYGGFGQVFGPVVNNHSDRNTYSASYTGYLGNHELKAGGDYEKVSTAGSTYWTGASRTSIFACGAGGHDCSSSAAPFSASSVPGYSSPYTGPVYYEHQFFTANATDLTPLVDAPFSTPTKRYSGYVQDQWRIIPSLTINFGVRYDAEKLYNGLQQLAFSLDNEWAPRVGATWDFTGDGTSKLYASAGRFYYAVPTDLNVRVFTANTSIVTWNYDPNSLLQAPDAPAGRSQLTQVGTFQGEPTDPGLKASYQDEFTIGVEKAIDPTLSVGLKGTYRSLGRTIEDRCDLNYATNPTGSSCALMNPGATGPENPGATGAFGSCDGSGNPTDPNAGTCTGPGQGTPIPLAKRIFKGIEFVMRKQFTNEIFAQLSYLGSSLRGNYSGAIREASGQTDPGINADFDYAAFTQNFRGILELDRPNQGRLDAVYNAPWGLSAGLQFYVRTGTPTSINGYYNQFYTTELYLAQRGYAGRLPTDYEMNMSLGYNINVGPVTITPQVYVFQLLNRQTTTAIDENFNVNGSFVTDPTSPLYGRPGLIPDGTCPVNSVTGTCSDNVNYRKTLNQTGPRQLRFALKVSF
ncbi:MAG TPA: TonB-dependent receptor, partial [Thermoanaerobaculia bacterium]|nr:TonB-dependent receptor [Thermoanaerobaculia bacterium]